ncbi:hypothetical protein CRENBAI_008346, partial [Crenichthys baileyi]
MNGVIKVQAWLDFLSEVYRSKLCSREFPAETLSLRRRVEQFSRSEGWTTGPHHRGYSSNVHFGQPTERTVPPHSYGACAPPMTSISSVSDRDTQRILRSYTYMANAEKQYNEQAGVR